MESYLVGDTKRMQKRNAAFDAEHLHKGLEGRIVPSPQGNTGVG